MEILAEAVKMAFGPKEILKGIDFSLHNKEFVGIIGPNGSGKSTFLNAFKQAAPVKTLFERKQRKITIRFIHASQSPY